eukprot:gene4429-8818_t
MSFAQDSPTFIYLCTGLTLIVVILTYFLFKKGSGTKDDQTIDVSKSLKKADIAVDDSLTKDKVLNPLTFQNFKLIDVVTISHNTKLLKFKIPGSQSIGLPIGRHISVRAVIDGNKVTRAYTPTSRPDVKGYFELLVKSYEFGKMSSHLHTLKVDQELEVRGPIGNFKYVPNKYPTIGLIAGGTGLTPCLQVIRCVLEGPDAAQDNTNFILFFQNRKHEDILLHNELQELQLQHPQRLAIIYFLSNPSDHPSWGKTNTHTEKIGYISQEMISSYMSPEKCPLVCICGPSGFNDAMKSLLIQSGHIADNGSIYVW